MSKKSIIIIGKGPSVLNCTKEIINSYEDIAIINYPVLNDFFYPLIKDRIINYHFCNFGMFDKRYNDKINKDLKIEKLYNTHYRKERNYLNSLKDKSIFKGDIRETGMQNLENLGFDNYDPCSGILSLNFIVNLGIYDRICLVGFDGLKTGKKYYYFDMKTEGNDFCKNLIRRGYFTKEGVYLKKSGHSPEKEKEYIELLKNDANLSINFIF